MPKALDRRGFIAAATASLVSAPSILRAAEPMRITVAPMTPSPVAWTAYFIGQPLGFYAAENLEVDLIKNPPRGSQASGLLTNQMLFGGLSSTNNMPSAQTKGLLKWFVVHEGFPFSIVVGEQSPIRAVADLGAKTIGIRSANDLPAVQLLMAAGNHLPGSYKSLVVGPGLPGGVALQRGLADALLVTAVDQLEISDSGIKLRTIDLGAATGLYNGGLMARADTLANRRDVAVRFGRALAKGYVWTYENPDASLTELAKVVPEAMQDRANAARILLATNAQNRERYDARFKVDPAVFKKQIALLGEVGLLPEPPTADEIFTNDLLGEIWNFDIDAVKAAARKG